MGLRIQTNIASKNAQRNLAKATKDLGDSYRRLSTGLRVANAADDAAGLAISERLRAQIRSIAQAERNANDGISLVQTAEGALAEVNNILVRMRELAIQASNGTVSNRDKDTLNEEFQAIIGEIDRISQATKFSELNLLDGANPIVTLQIGPSTTLGVDTFDITFQSVRATDLALTSLDIGSGTTATSVIDDIDAAINTVVQLRGSLGATQNRLQSTIAQLQVDQENLTSAESRIRDLDVASETANLTRSSILQQAAISILAQANIQPQSALQLLQQG